MLPTQKACILSHVKALEFAIESGCEWFAIFEDDVSFLQTFENDFKQALKTLPSAAKIIYLGGQKCGKHTTINGEWQQVQNLWGAFAYCVHKSILKELRDLLFYGIKITDAQLILMQQKYLCVIPKKRLVIHNNGYSFIREKQMNYPNLI